MNKSQRMRIKAIAIILGTISILAILIATAFSLYIKRLRGGDPFLFFRPFQKEITTMENVWIMESDADSIMVFRDGEIFEYPYSKLLTDFVERLTVREQVADIELTDGEVSGVTIKQDIIHGRVLSADSSAIELEEYGTIPLQDGYKGYRLYNTLEMSSIGDLLFGYDFADYVLDKTGEICAILLAREEVMEDIRVLIMNEGFQENLHQELVITSNVDFTLTYGLVDEKKTVAFKAGEELVLQKDCAYFEGDISKATGNHLVITPNAHTGKLYIKNMKRAQGVPAYRGIFEVKNTSEGMALVNELPLEEYLYSVVPSEMPSGYPVEALKTQAICARTYAYGNMQHAGFPKYGAHVNDSTSFQVYNNIQELEKTTTAVKDTYGQLLVSAQTGKAAETYFYSTSCGVGTDANVWKGRVSESLAYLHGKPLTKSAVKAGVEDASGQEIQAAIAYAEQLSDNDTFERFIRTKDPDAFEVDQSWYRWVYTVEELDVNLIYENMLKRQKASKNLVLVWNGKEFATGTVEEFTSVQNMEIVKRSVGGVADELVLTTDNGQYKIITEYNIRYIFYQGGKSLKNDGKMGSIGSLIPSAYMVIDPIMDGENMKGFVITGGGYGHGVGMCQVGSKLMADEGYTALQILRYFYDDCNIEYMYG